MNGSLSFQCLLVNTTFLIKLLLKGQLHPETRFSAYFIGLPILVLLILTLKIWDLFEI